MIIPPEIIIYYSLYYSFRRNLVTGKIVQITKYARAIPQKSRPSFQMNEIFVFLKLQACDFEKPMEK